MTDTITLTKSDVLMAILSGDLDNDLQTIIDTARNRQEAAAFQNLAVGDKVKITNIKPKYLIGHVGTVVKFNQSRIVVDLGQTGTKFNGEVTIPAACLVKAN